MQVQSDSRIENIRKVSRYFLYILSALKIIVPILTILLIFVFLDMPRGNGSYMEILAYSAYPEMIYPKEIQGFTLLSKVFLLVNMVTSAVFLEYVLINLHKLVVCFNQGKIFNRQAIFYARKAFKFNFIWILVKLILDILGGSYGVLYMNLDWSKLIVQLIGITLEGAIWLGFLSLIIWALEIGVDLNEESELTI